MLITSLQNSSIKDVVRLHHRKGREEKGLILIEGEHPIEEAVKAGVVIKEVYLREGYERDFRCGEVYVVTEAVMHKISTTQGVVPVVAVAEMPWHQREDVFSKLQFIVLGLFGIQDPSNLGALIRTAAAFDVDGVVVIGAGVDFYNPKVIRASTGLVFRQAVLTFKTVDDLMNALSDQSSVQVLAAHMYSGQSYRDVSYEDQVLLLLGGEGPGLPEDVWGVAQQVHIPMNDGIDSLNVGVAGGIVLSEIYQQRNHSAVQPVEG